MVASIGDLLRKEEHPRTVDVIPQSPKGCVADMLLKALFVHVACDGGLLVSYESPHQQKVVLLSCLCALRPQSLRSGVLSPSVSNGDALLHPGPSYVSRSKDRRAKNILLVHVEPQTEIVCLH